MSTTYAPGPVPARADNVAQAPRISEDWLSLIIGLFIFVLALADRLEPRHRCRAAGRARDRQSPVPGRELIAA